MIAPSNGGYGGIRSLRLETDGRLLDRWFETDDRIATILGRVFRRRVISVGHTIR